MGEGGLLARVAEVLALGLWSTEVLHGLLLADFSCRSERFGRAGLPGVLLIV